MAEGVNFVMVRTVFGAVLGMFYFGYNTGVVNAPQGSIEKFINTSYEKHYGSWISENKLETIFTVITSAFIGNKTNLYHITQFTHIRCDELIQYIGVSSWRNDWRHGWRSIGGYVWEKEGSLD